MKIDRSSEKFSFFQIVEIIEEKYLFNADYTEEALPSYERMAGEFGVSKVTAENAVKFLKEVGQLHSEVGRGTFINREPMHEQAVRNIYMVSLDAFNPRNSFFHKQLSSELATDATRRGLGFNYRYIADTHQQTNYVDLHRLVRTAGNAFIFLGDNPDYQSLLDVLERQRQPYIHLGKLETPDRPNLRSIIEEQNMADSVTLAMKHLIVLGHHRIALLGVDNSEVAQMRIHAYRTVLEYLLPDAQPNIISETSAEPDVKAGWQMLSQALEKGRDFTAIIALNDQLAAGAIIALKDYGIKVPEQVSVVGYDNELGLVDDFIPSITSIESDLSRMAENILDRLLDNATAALIPQRLYTRESSGNKGSNAKYKD